MASYRAPAAETRGFSFRRDANNQHIPPVRDESRSNTEQKISFSSKEASIRPAMSNDKPSNVTEGHIRNQARPSALPRSTSSSSQARLSYIASTRPMPSFAGKSPPLQAMRLPPNAANSLQIDTSGSSITQKARQDSLKQTASPLDMDDDTVLGIVMPEKPSTYPPATLPPRLIPELQALAASTNGPLNIPSSSISTISSPSTQFTASSSPWSASTAATTPISWSSASPSVVQTAYGSSKRSHTVPMPANVRTKIPKMPTLKERNASAAASKATVASESERTGRKLRKTNNPELNPPPRSSSLKGNRSRSNSGATIKSDKQSAPEISIPKFPVPPVSSSAPALQINTQPEPTGRRQNPQISQGHTRLQEALNTAERPRGQRTAAYESSAQSLHDEHTSPRPRQLLEPLPVVQNQHRRLPSLSRRHHRQASTSEPESEKQSARSRLAKFSKLALFGRSKNSAEPEQKPQKLLSRKGPAAGTGHEGYGKFGRRLRKYSVSSSIAATESDTSLASISSRRPTERRQSRVSNISQEQSDLDEFAAPRMKPRIMMGGSQRGQVDSFQLMSKNRQMSDVSLSTVSSADSFPAYTRLASPRRERFPPEDEDTPPTLMTRRSQRLAESDEPFSFPGPIETQSLATTPCLDSRNTTQSSDLPTPGSTMYKIDPNLLEKQRNKSKRLRWNIFKRKDSISDAEKPVIRASSRSGVSVDVTPGPMHRPVPYYAMLGSESEDNTTASIGQYLREAAESPEKENDQEEMISVGFSDNEVMENPYVNRESILLPSAPIREFRQPPTAVSYDTPISGYESSSQNEAPEESAPGRRQPRLARVGRIPQVVSTRQQQQPAIPVQQQLRAHTRERLRRQASSERLPRLRTGDQPQVPSHVWSNLSRPEVEPSVQSSASQRRPITGEREFLRYAEVRNSDFTTSSESTGIISIAGPPLSQVPSFSKHPADYFSHEDDVWNEYDDFMDDIMSPASSIKSPQKQKKDKRTASRKELRQQSSGKDVAKAKGLAITPAALHATSSSKQFLDTPPLAPSNVTSSQELETPSEAEIRLRRSRIAAALHASYAPSSPFSMREFIDEYGRRGSGKYSERLSGSSAQASTPIMAIAQPQPPQPQREQSRPLQYENAAQLEEIERTKDPAKHSDRAYASLMVSRWLSFGRVLFSPAHKEIENNPEKHVLVIDGLGSEDWSIYCAVTYQNERAYVHDLKERRQRKHKAQSAQTVESAPPNHRRSEVSSFNDKFPFPPEFFCAIVIRFPPAMPDSKLKNIVSECRRVLAPGGYLELVVLDLDIVNMGVQTRRAIKELKIKLTAADKTVSLKPIIDNVQTVLGSNGFSNLSRCVVGVPVVGKPAASLDSSSESRSSKGSTDLQEKSVSAGPRPYGSLGSQANFSLNDLVADHSENADAKIGKMVSRTARSWWQHCFEAGIMMKGGKSKSVFANKEVLAECKSRGASFKLLIAYTQKPMNPQRERSMSEPTVATLVTAGARTLRNQR